MPQNAEAVSRPHLKVTVDNVCELYYHFHKQYSFQRSKMKSKTKAGIISAINVALCGLFIMCACNSGDKFDWILSDIGSGVNFHTQTQTYYLNEPKPENTDDLGSFNNYNIKNYAKGDKELSRPEAIHFEWSATPVGQTDTTGVQYTLELYTTNFTSPEVYYSTNQTEIDVYNLYVGADYKWRVTAELPNGEKSVSDWAKFSTDGAAPRNLYVDGVTNVRDLGGWKTTDGKTVKQGMIIRCGRLNKSETTNYTVEITEDGVDTMLNVLGVRSEIDLRSPTKHNNEAGGITQENAPLTQGGVIYRNFAMEWNVTNMLTDKGNQEQIRNIFEFLADKDNYPVIYHCNIGTDRTGLIAILVNGLLGVTEADLYRDYLFSNFGNINTGGNPRTVNNISKYIETIKSYEGESFSEKVENCLIKLVNVDPDHIDSIRELMLY